jgi:hypothetical protein
MVVCLIRAARRFLDNHASLVRAACGWLDNNHGAVAENQNLATSATAKAL